MSLPSLEYAVDTSDCNNTREAGATVVQAEHQPMHRQYEEVHDRHRQKDAIQLVAAAAGTGSGTTAQQTAAHQPTLSQHGSDAMIRCGPIYAPQDQHLSILSVGNAVNMPTVPVQISAPIPVRLPFVPVLEKNPPHSNYNNDLANKDMPVAVNTSANTKASTNSSIVITHPVINNTDQSNKMERHKRVQISTISNNLVNKDMPVAVNTSTNTKASTKSSSDIMQRQKHVQTSTISNDFVKKDMPVVVNTSTNTQASAKSSIAVTHLVINNTDQTNKMERHKHVQTSTISNDLVNKDLPVAVNTSTNTKASAKSSVDVMQRQKHVQTSTISNDFVKKDMPVVVNTSANTQASTNSSIAVTHLVINNTDQTNKMERHKHGQTSTISNDLVNKDLPVAVNTSTNTKASAKSARKRNHFETNNSNKSSSVQLTLKKKQNKAVQGITEWKIPPSVPENNKYEFILASLKQGINPNSNIENQQLSNSLHFTIKRRIRRTAKKNHQQLLIIPKITGAAFDNRFLEYKVSSTGIEQKEKLVITSPLSFFRKNYRAEDNRAAGRKHGECIEQIPDEPPRTKTSSRIGPLYEAPVLPKINTAAFAEGCSSLDNDNLLPGHDTLWDPQLAKEAEERGEDISGFLDGSHELCNHELLFSILHNNNYCVKSALKDYKRVEGLYNNKRTSSKLDRNESRKFDELIREKQKNFSSIAKTLKRKRSDCLTHYYIWKTNDRSYQKLKKVWKEQYCAVCEDGGDLIICDSCNLSFHIGCLKPPMTTVPEGEFFCHFCRDDKKVTNKRNDILLSPIQSAGRRRLSLGSTCSKGSSISTPFIEGVVSDNRTDIDSSKGSVKVLF